MEASHLTVNFPGFAVNDTLKCAEDGSLKLMCDVDTGNQSLSNYTFPCCHLLVTVGSDRKQCSYSDNETCTILLTVDECSQRVNVDAYAYTDTVDASSQTLATRTLDGKFTPLLNNYMR